MECNNDVRSYVLCFFTEHSPKVDKSLPARIINGMMRSRIETMDALCAMSPERIYMLRNIGAKSAAVILKIREKYMQEQNKR